MNKLQLEKIFENVPIPNPNNKGVRYVCGMRLYQKKIIKAILTKYHKAEVEKWILVKLANV